MSDSGLGVQHGFAKRIFVLSVPMIDAITAFPPAGGFAVAGVFGLSHGCRIPTRRYVIRGTDLYTSMDYWNSGTWTRRIPIAELDVPASVKLNAARGGNFSLPTRSYEVIVRF